MAFPSEKTIQASGILEEGHAIYSNFIYLLRKLLALFLDMFLIEC